MFKIFDSAYFHPILNGIFGLKQDITGPKKKKPIAHLKSLQIWAKKEYILFTTTILPIHFQLA